MMNLHPLNFSTSRRQLWAVMTRLIADNNLNAQARTPNPASSIQDMLIILQSLQVQLLVNRIFDSKSIDFYSSFRCSQTYKNILSGPYARANMPTYRKSHKPLFAPEAQHACLQGSALRRLLYSHSSFCPFLRCTQVGMLPKAQL